VRVCARARGRSSLSPPSTQRTATVMMCVVCSRRTWSLYFISFFFFFNVSLRLSLTRSFSLSATPRRAALARPKPSSTRARNVCTTTTASCTTTTTKVERSPPRQRRRDATFYRRIDFLQKNPYRHIRIKRVSDKYSR